MDTSLIIALAALVVILIIVLTFSPVLVWADRRQSAMIQDGTVGILLTQVEMGGRMAGMVNEFQGRPEG